MQSGVDTVHRPPIGHNPTGERPGVLEDVVQEMVVLTGVDAVHAIVRAHHRARMTALERKFEREQIALAHCCFADICREQESPGLLIVHCKMLHGGDHVMGLNAADSGARQRSGQKRILSEIFKFWPLRGSRARFNPGPSKTLKPLRQASSPIVEPS